MLGIVIDVRIKLDPLEKKGGLAVVYRKGK